MTSDVADAVAVQGINELKKVAAIEKRVETAAKIDIAVEDAVGDFAVDA